MAKLTIALASQQEVIAFTFGKDRAAQIKTLRERIAADTAELNRLLAEDEGKQLTNVLSLLKGLKIKTVDNPELKHLEIPGVKNAVAEVDLGLPKSPTQSYALTLLLNRGGSFAFSVIKQRVEFLNYGGHRPNVRNR